MYKLYQLGTFKCIDNILYILLLCCITCQHSKCILCISCPAAGLICFPNERCNFFSMLHKYLTGQIYPLESKELWKHTHNIAKVCGWNLSIQNYTKLSNLLELAFVTNPSPLLSLAATNGLDCVTSSKNFENLLQI